MYRALFFDLGKVIVPFDFAPGYKALEQLCPYSAGEIPERLRSTTLVRDFETGRMESREFVRLMSGHLQLQIEYDEFCRIWSSIFLPETLIPDELLEALSREYPLYLVSNTNAIHFEMIQAKYPILRHFEGFVLSYQVGAMKPAPEIFQAALAMANCEPGECLFIDDLQENVEGARKFGFDAIQFLSCAKLLDDFNKRNICQTSVTRIP